MASNLVCTLTHIHDTARGFRRKGWCGYGYKCKYSHGAPDGAAAAPYYEDEEVSDEYPVNAELDERAENCGFTHEEFNTLLSHGIKPWDDWEEAYHFLAQLDNLHDEAQQVNASNPRNEVGMIFRTSWFLLCRLIQ